MRACPIALLAICCGSMAALCHGADPSDLEGLDAAGQTKALVELASARGGRGIESQLHRLHMRGNARYEADQVFDAIAATLAATTDNDRQESLRRALLRASIGRAVDRFASEIKWTVDDPRTLEVLLAAADQRHRLGSPQVHDMASDILAKFTAGRALPQFEASAVIACAAFDDPARASVIIEALWKLDARDPSMVAIAGYRAIGGFDYRRPIQQWVVNEGSLLSGEAEFLDESDQGKELRRIYYSPLLSYWKGDIVYASPYVLVFDPAVPPLKELPQLAADFRTLGLNETAREVEKVIGILGPTYLEAPPEKRKEAATPQMIDAVRQIGGQPHNTWKPLLYLEKLAATHPEAFKLRRK